MSKKQETVIFTKKELVQMIGDYLQAQGNAPADGSHIDLIIRPYQIVVMYEPAEEE